ncbi:helix-turn-helix transcriptional regulator [Anaerotruncus rubiinfantis]|uniref:helix-turn-helix transcriptional regulator n=1 Tax=Anaerotruncus rubiinfantis TaxID=1720200 RepID=UPI0034A28900
MFINKARDGCNNVCGKLVAKYRKQLSPKVSQKKLADMLQLEGLDVEKHAIRRIENGTRFVTDIELVILARVLNVEIYDLIDYENLPRK